MQRQRHISPELNRVIVVDVEGEPRERRSVLLLERVQCLLHRRCFAEACRGADERHRNVDEMVQPWGEALAGNETRMGGGSGDFGYEQRFAHRTPIIVCPFRYCIVSQVRRGACVAPVRDK